jgi:hypothetical protein
VLFAPGNGTVLVDDTRLVDGGDMTTSTGTRDTAALAATFGWFAGRKPEPGERIEPFNKDAPR